MNLREWIRAAPEGVSLTWEPGALARAMGEESGTGRAWVGCAEAVEITGKAESVVRRLGTRWERMQLKGMSPPVTVRRKSDAVGSHILYDEAELRAWCGAEEAVDPDSEDAVVAFAVGQLLRQHRGDSSVRACGATKRAKRGSTG